MKNNLQQNVDPFLAYKILYIFAVSFTIKFSPCTKWRLRRSTIKLFYKQQVTFYNQTRLLGKNYIFYILDF